MSINTAVKGIEDAFITIISNAAITGINGIVFNRELREGNLDPPYFHIFLEADIDNVNVSIGEEWFFRFIIMCVAAHYESGDADQARDLVLQASTLFINDRSINNTVEDLVRVKYDANYDIELPNEHLFGAAVELEARTIILEA